MLPYHVYKNLFRLTSFKIAPFFVKHQMKLEHIFVWAKSDLKKGSFLLLLDTFAYFTLLNAWIHAKYKLQVVILFL